MGAAIFPVFEGPIPGFVDPAVEMGGKPLSRAYESLDEMAEELGVPTLGSFISMNREGALLGEGEIDEEELDKIQENWTSPTDGLTTVRALLGRLRDDPDSLRLPRPDTNIKAEDVVEELSLLKSMLESAESAMIRFHLSVDF